MFIIRSSKTLYVYTLKIIATPLLSCPATLLPGKKKNFIDCRLYMLLHCFYAHKIISNIISNSEDVSYLRFCHLFLSTALTLNNG